MLVELSEEQNKLINTVALQNGFTGDFEVDTFPGTEKGDNYMGIITRVAIKDKERKLELILKAASTSEALRQAAPIQIVYSREIYLYATIFEEFKKFQDEFKISNPFCGYAKLYGHSLKDGNECLLMENITETGYKLWNRKIPMNAEHISAVFAEYAKFHAVSLAMRHKTPDLYEELTKDIVEHAYQKDIDDRNRTKAYVDSILANGFKALEDEPELLEALKKFGDTILDYLTQKFMDPKWNFVVTHGDCWCNNLMFKYETPETNTKISNVCILDWQMVRKGSPAADLTYFFLSHSPEDILYDYKTYLKLYHAVLCKNLRDFSCDPEEIFPYSLLEEHWKKFFDLGLYTSLITIKVMCYDTDEAPDLAEISNSGKELTTSFSSKFRNITEYSERIKILMKFVVSTGMIS